MVRRWAFILCLLPWWAGAQEVLLPLQKAAREVVLPKEATEVRLPFIDDFSDYTGAPAAALWSTADAFVNSDYALYPPTVGVATLDALDGHGALHAGATSSRFGADTLCSQPIRLDSLFSPTRKRLSPADSVYLSFYYLPGGGTGPLWERIGEAPDEEDSLLVEFYDPEADTWQTVWATGGISEDTLIARTGHGWQYVCLPVAESRYFQRGFRFRFRNYASLDPNPKPGMVGNTDEWHIDYVYLQYNRRGNETTFRDVAFVRPAPSMLRHYQAMPARQFTADAMASHIDICITNLYSQTLTTQYGYTVYDEDGTSVAHYDGGHENAPAFLASNRGYQTAGAHANPPVSFAYPLNGRQRYTVEHVVTEGVSGDNHRNNDTLRYTQVFSDYYAYDDGVAENGYGIAITGNKAWLACGFALQVPDTLTALDICFNQTRGDENLSLKFYICVWSCANGRPGTLLWRDEVRHTVVAEGHNRFHRYLLGSPLVVADSLFIGLEQQGSAYLNMGFDRNNDARQHTWYKTGNTWQQSILKGALMLRPRFGVSGTLDAPSIDLPYAVSLYPNPTERLVSIESHGWEIARAEVFDTHGRRVLTTPPTDDTLDLGTLPQGLYIILLTGHDGQQITRKILHK